MEGVQSFELTQANSNVRSRNDMWWPSLYRVSIRQSDQFGLADDVRFDRQPAGSGLTWHSDSRESLWMLTSRSFRVLVLTNGL